MSERFSGGFITKTPVTPTSTSASGIWTLDQQEQAQKAGNWPFGGPFNYIEDVFSTYLYIGNGNTNAQTITNNIDLSGKGGMVWIKSRSAAYAPTATDTARGSGNQLNQNTTDPNSPTGAYGISFNNNGFNIGTSGTGSSNGQNFLDATFASWTFRKQPKFFDVVTYTGDGTASRTIPHNLGSTPGMVVIKSTSDAGSNWIVWHRGMTGTNPWLLLNTDYPLSALGNYGVSLAPSSTTFTCAKKTSTAYTTNDNGSTYVAYLFAHDAGGFGPTSTDNVISCGSFTSDASGNATVNLGYEPQWVVIKNTSVAEDWYQLDTMRGWNMADSDKYLRPNTSSAEGGTLFGNPTATGFYMQAPAASNTYIYIAIRRGPMKVPTDATSVFSPVSSAASTGTVVTTGFPLDLQIQAYRSGPNSNFVDRLRGVSSTSTASGPYLRSSATAAEISPGSTTQMVDNTSFQITASFSGASTAYWNFRRAPSFFDEVCYTGTGSARTLNHNLGAIPELMIIKNRNSSTWAWMIAKYVDASNVQQLGFNTSASADLDWASSDFYATPTATTFSVGTFAGVNGSGNGLVAYLFATCPGVSKVGSYTGTGATQTISCGFTGGARWVLIKRTDSTGDWYVWDTARGMVSGTDPSLLLNSTAAEVNANSIYTTTGGFQIVSTAAGINASGGSYIYLAIA